MSKYKLILPILIFLLPNSLFSQNFSLGIIEGYNDLSIDGNLLAYHATSKISYGIRANYNVCKYISLGTGVINERNEVLYIFDENSLGKYIDHLNKYKFNYLTVPLFLKLRAGKSKFFGEISLASSYLFKANSEKLERNRATLESKIFYENIDSKFNQFTFGLSYGLGFDQQLTSNLSISTLISYNKSLKGISIEQKDIRFYSIGGNIMLTYGFMNTKSHNTNVDSLSNDYAKSSVYIDFLGDANMYYSINYSHIFKRYHFNYFSIKVGFGYIPAKDGWKSI
jgi:hypothetical protein